jgi:hypothetical protein
VWRRSLRLLSACHGGVIGVGPVSVYGGRGRWHGERSREGNNRRKLRWWTWFVLLRAGRGGGADGKGTRPERGGSAARLSMRGAALSAQGLPAPGVRERVWSTGPTSQRVLTAAGPCGREARWAEVGNWAQRLFSFFFLFSTYFPFDLKF